MTKTKQNKLIVIILAVLVLLVAVLALLNRQLADQKLQLAIDQQLLVTTADGNQITVNFQDVLAQPQLEFEATRKANGKEPEQIQFTGVALAGLLQSKGVTVSATDKVALRSADGYSVTFDGAEVLDSENLALVYLQDGAELATPDAGGSGPYMAVVRKDPFSQRWSKMLTEVVITANDK